MTLVILEALKMLWTLSDLSNTDGVRTMKNRMTPLFMNKVLKYRSKIYDDASLEKVAKPFKKMFN